ncbi:MAG TPA: DNA mismatch repair protein MutS [Bacillota bacterium]|nr:DNA mismatch repair protein MutS [Bacillota bacterium]
MTYAHILLGLLVAAGIAALDSYRRGRNIRKRIRDDWGKPPAKQRWDVLESVAAYWNEKRNSHPNPDHLDEVTWNDLDMDRVFERINATCSSVGAEYLYARLHEVTHVGEELDDFEALVHSMEQNPELRERIALCLHRLGKNDYNGVTGFMFDLAGRRLRYAFLYPILATLPFFALGLAFFEWQAGIIALVAVSGINGVLYYRGKVQLAGEFVAVSYITSIVTAAGKLAKMTAKDLPVYSANLRNLAHTLNPVRRFGSAFLTGARTEMELLLEYVKIVFMVDYLSYNRVVATISKHHSEFHQLWREVGRLDAALAVASYRSSLDRYCQPEFVLGREVRAQDIYHPLVVNPVTNPLDFAQSVIITGSNASGKSTYVKAVAINAIFAQTIHTCLATRLVMRPSRVLTSMAVRDNVVEGDSYFIAEIKSLRRILNALSDEVHVLCFVDEILKGTNTIERIAASASILDYLADRNCLAMVASHDIELTELQEGIYDNLHFREKITQTGIEFDYLIRPGRTTTKNAIRLLSHLQYPDEIVGKAEALANHFTAIRKWQK